MFGSNFINGSVNWLGVPNLLSNDEPPWTLKLMDLYNILGDRGSSTRPNWGSGSVGHPGGVYIQ